MITCHDCKATVASVGEAVEADWLASGEEYGFDEPVCRACWEKRDAEIARKERERRERALAGLLLVRDHTDVCMIANAVREHCKQREGEAHWAFLAAKGRGDEAEAKRCLDLRHYFYQAANYYADRLDELRLAFEARMDAEAAQQDAADGMPGNYTGFGNGSHAPCGN